MAIAMTLKRYLDEHGADYEVVTHPRCFTSMQTAQAAHVPGENMAKCVMVGDGRNLLMTVVPATHKVALNRLPRMKNGRARLASEPEFTPLFADCEAGAMPVCGKAYGIPTVWDDALADCEDVYFEAGSHEELIHMSGPAFRQMMSDIPHGIFSRHR